MFTASADCHRHSRTMLVKVDCNLAAAVAEADYEDTLTAKGFSIAVYAAVHDTPGKALPGQGHDGRYGTAL